MNNMNPLNFARQFINNNARSIPQNQNNSLVQNCFNAIQTGDEKRGQQLIENLCKSYGITPQQALDYTRKIFGI